VSSKRFYVTLPAPYGERLDQWADIKAGKGKGKPATLAASLIKAAIDQAVRRGEIPLQSEELAYSSFMQLVTQNLQKLVESGRFETERLRVFLSGSEPTDVERLRVALILGLTEDYVTGLPVKDPDE
jgi:hypothetical protein